MLHTASKHHRFRQREELVTGGGPRYWWVGVGCNVSLWAVEMSLFGSRTESIRRPLRCLFLGLHRDLEGRKVSGPANTRITLAIYFEPGSCTGLLKMMWEIMRNTA
jgi:hypothetical protein